jgi:hypothetical protein
VLQADAMNGRVRDLKTCRESDLCWHSPSGPVVKLNVHERKQPTAPPTAPPVSPRVEDASG